MYLDQINAILKNLNTDEPNMRPTELYCEGWLMCLVLQYFETQLTFDYPIAFSTDANWFSEAELPSAFLKRPASGKRVNEGYTNADGVIGHFQIGKVGKADLVLDTDATQFTVIEAKIFSPLDSKTTNAPYFDQAARNVACMAEVLYRANRQPSELEKLGFYVLAPQSQIDKGIFAKYMQKSSIQKKVERRVSAYDGEKQAWYETWFLPMLEVIEIETIAWETVIDVIESRDESTGQNIREFYDLCLKYN